MEELEKSLTPTLDTATGIAGRIWMEFLVLVSIPQAVAISITLLVAVLGHLQFRDWVGGLFSELKATLWQQISRMILSVLMPVAWVIGLWLTLVIFNYLGWKTSLIRLVANLTNVWIVIQISATGFQMLRGRGHLPCLRRRLRR
jgi:hypothetical protein